jgi:hypothetical protein
VKLFLSWSGELSYRVAAALQKWLPYMIQPVRPFLSSDIRKGDRWAEVIERDLKDAQYGIICLTPDNLHKPWMIFEAGALSKVFDRASVTPFLFNVDPSRVTGPLAQFQSAVYTEGDVLKLIYSINSQLGHAALDREVLGETFDVWWKKLKEDLDAVALSAQEETGTEYSWLYTFDALERHEVDKDDTSVWIITSDLVKHATGNSVRQRVNGHLLKGIKYRFFVRDSDGIEDADLKQMRDSSQGILEYKVFDKEDFDIEAATDYIFINAD